MYGACVISVDNRRASTVAVLRTHCQLRVVGARAVIVLRPEEKKKTEAEKLSVCLQDQWSQVGHILESSQDVNRQVLGPDKLQNYIESNHYECGLDGMFTINMPVHVTP